MFFCVLLQLKKIVWMVFPQHLLSRILSSALAGSRLSSIVHVFVNFLLWYVIVHMNLLWWWPKTESGGQRIRRLCCCLKGTHQDGEKEWQEQINAGATELESSKENDLGKMDSSWTWATNTFFLLLKSCNCILSCTKRGIVSRLLKIILTLYSALVRPHLTYSVQFWAPQ